MAYADGNIVIGTSVDVGGMNTGLYKIQKAMKKLGRIATIGLTAGLYKLGRTAINAASDLQEIQNVVDVAFKDMSYKIEEFSKVCIQAFGMSELSAKQTAGSFMAMGASIGLTQEAASDMAIELTGLTGDFASFYNISQQYAKVALSAVYTGETETLKRYGIILTEANLQEYANTIGIQKKVKAMSAAEKTLLRYNYIMEATNNMHNDFERTQHSWANTVRVLQENWNALMAAMGSGLIQVFQPIVECLSIIVQKLLAIIKYINELLGIMSSGEEEEFTESIEDLGDAIDDTTKKAKNMLAPFDKLNNLTSSSTKSAKDDTDVLESLYDRMGLAGYVIEKLKNLSVQVENITEATKEKLKDLVNLFRRAVFRIKKIWGSVKLQRWFAAGSSLGEAIIAIQKFLRDAIAGVNWTDVGTDIGSFFEGIIWTDALGGWVDVLVEALNACVDTALGLMDKITFQDIIQLAKNYSKAARKLFRWLYNTIKKVDWYEFGKKVGTFISNLDWLGFFADAAGIIWEALIGAIKGWTGLLEAAPIATILITGIIAAIKIAQWIGLDDALRVSMKKAFRDWRRRKGVDGLENILQKALGTLALVASFALTVSNAVELASGQKSFDDAATRINEITSAGLATAGLVLTGAVGVAGGAIAFLIALTGNIVIDYLVADDEAAKAKRIEDLKERLGRLDWVNAVNESIDVLVNLSVKAEGRIADVTGDMDYYRDMAKEWEELSSQYDDLTSGEKALVGLYADQLKTKFPELIDSIDAVTGAYKGTTDQLQLLIDKTEEFMMVNAYLELKEEAYKALAQAQKDKNDFDKKYARTLELQSEVPKAIENYLTTAFPLQSEEVIQALYDAYGGKSGLIRSIETVMARGDNVFKIDIPESVKKKLLPEQLQLLNKQTKLKLEEISFPWSEDEELNNVYAYTTSIQLLLDKEVEVNEALIEAGFTIQEWDNKIKELMSDLSKKETLLPLLKLKTAFSTTFTGLDLKWGKDVKSAIDEIITKLDNDEDVTEELNKLFKLLNTGLEELPEGSLPEDVQETITNIKTKLSKGEITLQEAMQLLADAMVVGFNSGLGDPNTGTGVYKVLSDLRTNILKRLSTLQGDITETARNSIIKGIYDSTTAKAEEAYWNSLSASEKLRYKNQHEAFQTFGFDSFLKAINADASEIKKSADYVTDGFVDENDKNLPEWKKAGYSAMGAYFEGGNDFADINSPSKESAKQADYVVDGFVNELLHRVEDVRSAAITLMNAALTAFNSDDIKPQLTVLPSLAFNDSNIPDIAKGMVVPVSASGSSTNSNGLSNMSQKDLESMIERAVSNVAIHATFDVEGDPYNIFKVVQREFKVYKNQTNTVAFT